jgi:hypothetical protein
LGGAGVVKARLALTGPCLSDPETRGADRPVTTFGIKMLKLVSTLHQQGRISDDIMQVFVMELSLDID